MNKNIAYVLIGIILVAVVGWLAWNASKGDSTQKGEQDTTQSENQEEVSNETPEQEAVATGNCQRTFNNSNSNNVTVNPTDKFVTMTVEGFGDIKIEVNRTAAPKSSENFLKLASSGFYDCLTFHRILAGFVVQGGDPDGNGSGGPGYTIPAEIGLLHKKGTIAMARLGDQMNPSKASSGSQFYFSLQDLPELDGQYTVFGQVVSGMDVIEKIAAVDVAPGSGMPLEKVEITKAVVSAE